MHFRDVCLGRAKNVATAKSERGACLKAFLCLLLLPLCRILLSPHFPQGRNEYHGMEMLNFPSQGSIHQPSWQLYVVMQVTTVIAFVQLVLGLRGLV